MTRLCERPGCSQRAELYYGIDAEHLTVRIDSIDGASNVRAGVLCRRHADAMVVPLGWMLDDQREPVPQLFKVPAATAPVAERPRRQRPPAVSPQAEQLSLVDAAPAEAADEAAPEVDPDEETDEPAAAETVQPWVPVFDQTDDLNGLLGASGPLLSRAFRGTDRVPGRD